MPSAARSLTTALLLAFTGGLLDAFVYLNHGHVFASAMTGNGVLFGVALLNHDQTQAVRHLIPGIAFLLGVATSKALQKLLGANAIPAGLTLEIATLLVASSLPDSFPQMGFTAIIAFAAAYQVSSFRQVDDFAYNSTFITGNLRTAADGLSEALSPATRAEGLRKFRDLSLIVLSFLIGAILGAAAAPRLKNHTLWLALPALLAVLTLTMRTRVASPDRNSSVPFVPK